jgi:hypothetical protein
MKKTDKYNERYQRVMDTIQLKSTDRVPVVLEYAGFAARTAGVPMNEFISSYEFSTEVMIRAYQEIGDGDGINYAAPSCYGLATLYLSKIKVPGFDLPQDDEWQAHETELMHQSDYDAILEMGWPVFVEKFLEERVYNDAKQELLPKNQKDVDTRKMWQKAGVPVISGGATPTPLELICGARSLMPFVNDLFKIPDKLEKVFESILPHVAKNAIAYTRKWDFPCSWVVGCRSAPSMLSPAMFDRWVWPYFKHVVQEVTDAGQIALLHLDSNWTRELERFKELPQGKCILSLDGETDMREAKKILDGHMCIQGDVPAQMLAFGQPEDITQYAKNLINDIGSNGYILHSGCDIPTNAKLENVQAMVNAAIDFSA